MSGVGSGKLPIPVPSPTPQANGSANCSASRSSRWHFSSVTLQPRKMAVISTMTGELRRRGAGKCRRDLRQHLEHRHQARRGQRHARAAADGNRPGWPALWRRGLARQQRHDGRSESAARRSARQGRGSPVLVVNAVDAIAFATLPRDIGIPILFSVESIPASSLASMRRHSSGPPAIPKSTCAARRPCTKATCRCRSTAAPWPPVRSLWQTDERRQSDFRGGLGRCARLVDRRDRW